ncbi:MAG TPA: DMSO/selenate family reductase complex B subunit [Symbiobacteriaceae bacterium]|nr:DMSO/selenate family reductase complex B subunit [Symbiobacteriaceae bacterium]
MAQKGFYYDMTACIACKGCQVACKDKNDLPVGINYRKVHTFEGGSYPNPWLYNLSISCNHCEDAPCVKNCPTGARTKRTEDGLVIVNEEACIGCQYCVWSCPYGANSFVEEKGVVAKCNGCVDLTAAGGMPACVDACIMRALEFGDFEELKKKHPDAVMDVKGLPSSSLTGPSIIISPKPAARK